jgi:biotin operon repressor
MRGVLDWALYESGANRGARLVLTCLADNANARGVVTLPVNELAAMVSLSRQSISRAIDRLIAGGELAEVGKKGRSVSYRLGCFDEDGRFTGGKTQTETNNKET